MFTLRFITTLALSGLVCQVWAAPPTAVSPGEADRPAISTEPCPLLSWAATGESEYFELKIMYAGADDSDAAVHHVHLPGGTRAWQPPPGQCLEYGGSYTWSIRESNGSWGDPLQFRIVHRPGRAAVAYATEVLETWLKESTSGFEEKLEARIDDPLPRFTIAPDVTAISTAGTTMGGAQVTFGVHGVEPSAKPDSAAAVGEALSATGNVGGLIGQTASPAGVAAVFENNGGGLILETRTGALVGLRIDEAGTVFSPAFTGKGTGLTGVTDLACTGCVDGSEIDDFAINQDRLADLSVGHTKIPADAVDGTVIGFDAVEAEEIATGAVTAAKIAANAVTFNKLADGAVGALEIAPGAVTEAHFKDETLTRKNFDGTEKKVYSTHADCDGAGKATLQTQCNSSLCDASPVTFLDCNDNCSAAGSPASCNNADAGWLLSPSMDP